MAVPPGFSSKWTSVVELVLDAALLGVWESRQDRTALFDKRARELHQLPPDVLVTPALAWAVIHPDDRDKVSRAIEAAGESDVPGHFHVEYRLNSSDTLRWLRVHAQVIKRGEVLLGGRGIVQDVTADKVKEHRRELILGEMQHRLKNVFSLVHHVARNTLSKENITASSWSTFEFRLNALAQAEKAVEIGSGTLSASLRRIISHTCRGFCGPGVVSVTGADVRLNSDTATALALVLHELLTNATKYGSLSVSGGRINISWDVTVRGSDLLLELTWSEIGGPAAQPPANEGFGTRLIRGLITYGMDSANSVAVDYLPSGLVCKLTVVVQAQG
jgi:two-component sensor histidine kinase